MPDRPFTLGGRTDWSVAVVLRFVRTLDVYAQVIRLRLRQLRESDTKRIQVQAGDLFVEVLRQRVDADRVLLKLREQLDLGNRLVGERIGHDEARVAGGVA